MSQRSRSILYSAIVIILVSTPLFAQRRAAVRWHALL